MGISTLSEETASITGTDWDQKVDRIRREKKIMSEINGAQGNPKNPTTNKNETSEQELEDGDDEE